MTALYNIPHTINIPPLSVMAHEMLGNRNPSPVLVKFKEVVECCCTNNICKVMTRKVQSKWRYFILQK